MMSLERGDLTSKHIWLRSRSDHTGNAAAAPGARINLIQNDGWAARLAIRIEIVTAVNENYVIPYVFINKLPVVGYAKKCGQRKWESKIAEAVIRAAARRFNFYWP